MRMTQAEIDAYHARQSAASIKWGDSNEGVEKEILLHREVLAECARRGWICLHGATHTRALRTAGEFDCTILADGGRVFFIELKRKDGKLSQGQQALHYHAKTLGHQTHIVRSIQQFNQVVDDKINLNTPDNSGNQPKTNE